MALIRVFTTTAILSLGSGLALAQSPRPTPAVPAAPGRYDFHWETYTVNAAPSGKAFYIFQGEFEDQQPIGIAVLGENGNPQIFSIVSGNAAEALEASFERFKKAKGARANALLLRTVAPTSIKRPLRTTTGGPTPTVAFDPDGSHVLLSHGTTVDFLAGRTEVIMPATQAGLPPIKIEFRPRDERNAVDHAAFETGVTFNGRPLECRRKSPLWEALKDLVLDVALARASQAAQIAAMASGRPVDAPDYVARVADIVRHLD